MVLMIAAAFSVVYLYIDRRVAGRLSQRSSAPPLAAVYSDMFTLNPHRPVGPAQLREQLIKRRYREASSAPAVAGEFRLSGSALEIVTREFRGPDGLTRPSQRVIIKDISSSDYEALSIEPQVIAALGGGDIRAAEYKTLEQFPDHLAQAVIAVEDERFYRHRGVDFTGILRAAAENVRAMRIVQGGSTITQQLAKNLFFAPARSIIRKVLEAFAAVSLENRLSKEQILELYLNEVYFGQEGAVAIHGVAEAAKTFLGKKVEALSLSESALLAGVIKAPSYYSPRKHFKRSIQRRNIVLQRMLDLNMIGLSEYKNASQIRIPIIAENLHQRKAPYFIESLKQQLAASFNIEALILEGLAVHTGLDLDMQECAENAVSKVLAVLEKQHPGLKRSRGALQGALVAIEPYSGKIRAWVGGRNFAASQFDRVSQAKRQVGSTIKPFVYLTALDRNLNRYKVATAASILSDRPMEINLVTRDAWVPENYDHEFRGDVSLRYALENSLNLPAVYITQKYGIEALARTIESFKLAHEVLPVPALALGATDTTLLNLTAAYAGLANGGVYAEPRPFISIIDAAGQILASSAVHEERIAGEDAGYVLSNILQGVIERGTGKTVRRLGYSAPAAGKTGTTNETRDAWFEGFTPDLAAGVWVGFDDNRKIGLTGGVAAAPIWAEFMKCVSKFHAALDFLPPPGVVFIEIDAATGQLATTECPQENIITEVYVRGTEPRRPCREHAGAPKEEVPDYSLPQRMPKRPRRERSFWDILLGR